MSSQKITASDLAIWPTTLSSVLLLFSIAILDLTRAIEISPQLAEAYCNRGFCRMGKWDFDGAIADCTKAIEIDPNYARAYGNRGLSL
jgi:lipoprotein NlpI